MPTSKRWENFMDFGRPQSRAQPGSSSSAQLRSPQDHTSVQEEARRIPISAPERAPERSPSQENSYQATAATGSTGQDDGLSSSPYKATDHGTTASERGDGPSSSQQDITDQGETASDHQPSNRRAGTTPLASLPTGLFTAPLGFRSIWNVARTHVVLFRPKSAEQTKPGSSPNAGTHGAADTGVQPPVGTTQNGGRLRKLRYFLTLAMVCCLLYFMNASTPGIHVRLLLEAGRRPLPTHLFEFKALNNLSSEARSLDVFLHHVSLPDSHLAQLVPHIANTCQKCRSPVARVSKQLSTTVTDRMQEWAFNRNCTPALVPALRNSHDEAREATDCVSTVSSTTDAALHATDDVISDRNKTLQKIDRERRDLYVWGRGGKAELMRLEAARNATAASLHGFLDVRVRLLSMKGSSQPEYERYACLQGDLSKQLDLLQGWDGTDHVFPGDPTVRDGQTICWDCQRFDVKELEASFLTMAEKVIGDEGGIQRFRSRYNTLRGTRT